MKEYNNIIVIIKIITLENNILSVLQSQLNTYYNVKYFFGHWKQ